ncbi:MAG: hypothetical protein LBR76_03045, partial [Oscillospiraceae bacterium]|nr:hypothetical protein [Oscillospiraceae bacterium]
YVFADGSTVQVYDIFNPLPEFMRAADAIFVDPPWNKINLNTFYTKAETPPVADYDAFYHRLFECIGEIKPAVTYVEVGKQYLAEFILALKKLYKHVTFYNSSYYHKRDNLCYVIRGSGKAKKPNLDCMDEEDIIKWICANEDYTCIGDLCMGRGLVGLHAHINGRRFVGTELNHKRLSVLLERINEYEHMKGEENHGNESVCRR